jgi:hypothetical protein
VDAASETSGLALDADHDVDFLLKKNDFWLVETCLLRPYVTVHHGFDINYLPSSSRKNLYATTKNISVVQWTEIVAALTALGLDVVQLRIAVEDRITGVTHCFNGLLSHVRRQGF